MVLDGGYHEKGLDDSHANESPEEGPCCNEKIANILSRTVSMTKKTRYRLWKPVNSVSRDVWIYISINVPMQPLRLPQPHVVDPEMHKSNLFWQLRK